MCGIVGLTFSYYKPYTPDEINSMREIFTSMLLSAERRGRGATGLMLVDRPSFQDDKRPTIFVMRAPVPAKEFVESEQYRNLMSRVGNNTCSIIGHTRAVTSGSATNNKNNHPHRTGNVIGVHNGVIRDKKIWSKYSEALTQKTQCDTEAIFALLDHKLGKDVKMLDALNEAMPEVIGSWSLAFVNLLSAAETHLLRNDSAPINLRFMNELKSYMFASEDTWLTTAAKEADVKETQFVDVPENMLVTVDSITSSHIAKLPGLKISSLAAQNSKQSKEFLSDAEDLQSIALAII